MRTSCFPCLQLGGFVEKYAGSGVTLQARSSSNKENRRTGGLNRYLQTLQSTQGSAPGDQTEQLGEAESICAQAFVERTKIQVFIYLLFKLLVAVPSLDQQGEAEADKVLSASPMMQVEGFFMSLTNSNADGRVVVHKQGIMFFTHYK